MAVETSEDVSAGFAGLGLDPRLVDALTKLGYEEPTPIQREAIPPLLLGRDLAGQAATGTGKTAAFALPLLQQLAARGADRAPESYVHRIGRVGRAGREGAAITLAEPREHRLLRNIEQLTKRKIAVGKVPTVADLRARKLELIGISLRETLLQDDVDQFRAVVESLAGEFDPMDIAMAAVKLAQDATARPSERALTRPAAAAAGAETGWPARCDAGAGTAGP
jgi:superfamily II DNA/RNA helicase